MAVEEVERMEFMSAGQETLGRPLGVRGDRATALRERSHSILHAPREAVRSEGASC